MAQSPFQPKSQEEQKEINKGRLPGLGAPAPRPGCYPRVEE